MQSLERAESEIFLNECNLGGRCGFESGEKYGMFFLEGFVLCGETKSAVDLQSSKRKNKPVIEGVAP